MVQREFENISKRLFQSYFERDITPPDLVSSHWAAMHKNTVVKGCSDDGMRGYGFGHFPKASLVDRFFSAATILAHRLRAPKVEGFSKLVISAKRLAKRIGHPFTLDLFRQVCTYALLHSRVAGKRFIVIGDGIGFLSAFIKEMEPEAQIVMVDLGKTLFFQVQTIRMAHPDARAWLVDNPEISAGDDGMGEFLFCPAEHLHFLEDNIFDCAVNTNSMQEMNKATVAMYFAFLRRTLSHEGLFYCSNRVEKIMPAGEVSRFSDYPWETGDVHFIDEICPWSVFFLHRNTLEKGPMFLGARVPFCNYYDGPIRHRLSKLQLHDGLRAGGAS